MGRRANPSIIRTFDLGIDIGSAQTVVASNKGDILFDEPTRVAFNIHTGQAVAFGYAALQIADAAGEKYRLINPLRRARPIHAEALHRFLSYVIQSLHKRGERSRSAFIAVSSLLTTSDQCLIKRIAQDAGIHEVVLVNNLVASSRDNYLLKDPEQSIAILDMGAEVTSWGLIYNGELKNSYIWEFGTKDLSQSTGSLDEPILKLSSELKDIFNSLPEDLLGSLVDSGINFCGGGALLPDLNQDLHLKTGLSMVIGAHPMHSCALGAAQTLMIL